MPVFVVVYAAVLAAAALLSATVGVVAFRRHAAGQSGWLAACMAAAAGWAAVAALEALVPTAPLKIFLSKMQYAAVVSVAPSWLMFGLAYAGLRCPRPLARGSLLWIPSALTLLLVWTNEWHGWIWPWFGDPPAGRGPLVYGHGPAVAIFAAYSYLLTLAGTGLILRTAYRAPLSHRRHAVPIGIAALLPIVLNLSYLSDVTAEREAAEAIGRRDAILDAVRETATHWLRHPAWREGMQESLLRLGAAADASRAYIFQVQADPAGRMRMSQQYEWCAPGVPPQIGNPGLQRTTFATPGHARWEARLASGQIHAARTRDLPPEERLELEQEGTRAILLVPIFVFERWWGFIGLDECRFDRVWSDAETGALRTAAGAFGAAIEREDMDTQRREGAERLRFIMDNIPGVLWAVDSSMNVTVLTGSALPAIGIASAPREPVPFDVLAAKAGLGIGSGERHRRALGGESIDYRLTLRGREFDCHLRPLHGPGATVTGAIGIALDVTERTADRTRTGQARHRRRAVRGGHPHHRSRRSDRVRQSRVRTGNRIQPRGGPRSDPGHPEERPPGRRVL
ncbi:MAG: hypothetical protein BWK77_02205 [Verrucomicrobia bacterium A1]|nr:MAG: hypothetical protein BWK77_02205 [Verrucomicrobia bacterium A1]